jgi:hypothetical protein
MQRPAHPYTSTLPAFDSTPHPPPPTKNIDDPGSCYTLFAVTFHQVLIV